MDRSALAFDLGSEEERSFFSDDLDEPKEPTKAAESLTPAPPALSPAPPALSPAPPALSPAPPALSPAPPALSPAPPAEKRERTKRAPLFPLRSVAAPPSEAAKVTEVGRVALPVDPLAERVTLPIRPVANQGPQRTAQRRLLIPREVRILAATFVGGVLALLGLVAIWPTAERTKSVPPGTVPANSPSLSLDEIDKALAREDFTAALIAMGRLSKEGSVSPDDPRLLLRKSRAESEQRNRAYYETLRASVAKDQYEGALALYQSIPKDSVYKDRADQTAQRIREAYLARLLSSKERSSEAAHACQDLTRLQRMLTQGTDLQKDSPVNRAITRRCDPEQDPEPNKVARAPRAQNVQRAERAERTVRLPRPPPVPEERQSRGELLDPFAR